MAGPTIQPSRVSIGGGSEPPLAALRVSQLIQYPLKRVDAGTKTAIPMKRPRDLMVRCHERRILVAERSPQRLS
jgi:hypothetical protein